MHGLVVEGVRKRFGDVVALDDVSLAAAPGEFLSLLGASGCGKTTLLRIIAGFAAADSGRILRGDADISRLPPARRRIGLVFQSYALFPTKTVAQNIGFALEVARRPRAEIAARVRELAGITELDLLLERFPHELSGGQQQRVALARALAPGPELMVLDEPLSALDARIRARLRDEIRAIVDRLGVTAIYVTHDQEEALALSDRVAVMQAGRIEQIGTPVEIYHRPASRFVAEFVGTANFFDGRLAASGVDTGDHLWPATVPQNLPAHAPVTLIYRPEHFRLAANGHGIRARIVRKAFLGAVVRTEVTTEAGRRLIVDLPSTAQLGETVLLEPDAAAGTVLLRGAA
jgi:putative spermidine/putrescine transport system ATP-binding protein